MAHLAKAAALLRGGGLVAFPTETVYGLGADATSPAAVARIFAAKGRPRFNPLIAHVADLEAAHREGRFDANAERLASAFWPGPLTLVLPRTASGTVCDLARAGLDTIGLRVPAHPLAAALLREVGIPVAAPSANPSGRLSPTRAADVAADLPLDPKRDAILDGGACDVGVESTIVSCLGATPVLLRPGGVAREAIEAVLRCSLAAPGPNIQAPGMLASHYAPVAPLRLAVASLELGEIGLDFARRLDGSTLDLSPDGDLSEAAANLYRYLRELDAARPERIAVAPIPPGGLGSAINDRLRRAAAPRI